MTGILDLPCELVASILRKLDNIKSLPPALLACRHSHKSYEENSNLKYEIVRRQLGPGLFPYAVAVQVLSTCGGARTLEGATWVLDSLYNDPAKLDDPLKDMYLSDVLEIGRLHDLVHEVATTFAQQAWSLLSAEQLALSVPEYVRFCRAFYRYELLCILINAVPKGIASISEVPQGPKRDLLARHAPWENEQIVCVHDFLEEKLGGAIREALAHDVILGEQSIDYLSRGDGAPWIQKWLAKGIRSIQRIQNYSSYSEKVDLLHSYIHNSDHCETTPWDQLCLEFNEEADADDGTPLSAFTEADSERLNPRAHCKEDLDDGPVDTWRRFHIDLPRNAFVMFAENSGCRDRAYVFWDRVRLRRYGIFGPSSDPPPRSEVDPDGEEWRMMERSWDERSKIWLKGGRGYWKEGDLSGIEWRSSRGEMEGHGD